MNRFFHPRKGWNSTELISTDLQKEFLDKELGLKLTKLPGGLLYSFTIESGSEPTIQLFERPFNDFIWNFIRVYASAILLDRKDNLEDPKVD